MNENNNMLQQNNTQIQQNHIQQNKSVYHQASAVDRHLHTISTYNYLSEEQKKRNTRHGNYAYRIQQSGT